MVNRGQEVTATGPDGTTHRGRVLDAYRSTGGIVSVWIDLSCARWRASWRRLASAVPPPCSPAF